MATMLRLERQGPLAVLTLDRPPANALNRDFFSEVGTVLPALAAADVRGVVVTGTGRFFSAGLDLFEILTYRGAEASALVSFAASKRALRAESLARIAAARATGEDPIWAVWRTPETRAAIEAFAARAIGARGRR